ncbi:hypothetical protein L195_g043495, partial [Trifolium pratense]
GRWSAGSPLSKWLTTGQAADPRRGLYLQIVGETVICSYLGGEVPPCSADMDMVGQAIMDLESMMLD